MWGFLILSNIVTDEERPPAMLSIHTGEPRIYQGAKFTRSVYPTVVADACGIDYSVIF